MKPPEKKQEKKVPSKEQEYLEGWKRARADLDNIQKRQAVMREQELLVLKRSVVEPFITLADNFQSLVEHAPDTKSPWVEGVLHIARQFKQQLQEFGVEAIDDTDKEFNPSKHEAVAQVKGEEGKVISVVQVGYKIGDIVIRPAKVEVGSTPPGADKKKQDH